jgi:hypothetical protein
VAATPLHQEVYRYPSTASAFLSAVSPFPDPLNQYEINSACRLEVHIHSSRRKYQDPNITQCSIACPSFARLDGIANSVQPWAFYLCQPSSIADLHFFRHFLDTRAPSTKKRRSPSSATVVPPALTERPALTSLVSAPRYLPDTQKADPFSVLLIVYCDYYKKTAPAKAEINSEIRTPSQEEHQIQWSILRRWYYYQPKECSRPLERCHRPMPINTRSRSWSTWKTKGSSVEGTETFNSDARRASLGLLRILKIS